MIELKKEHYSILIELGLKEDIGEGDITGIATVDEDSISEAILLSKNSGVLCGIDVFCDTFLYLNKNIEIEKKFNDGKLIIKSDIVATIKGNTRDLLKAERTALNFIQRMSGIATKTHNYLKRIKNYNTKILDTRKTIPAYRMIDKYSVFIGKGLNHRMGLYDMFLIKDNHIKASGGITNAIKKARGYNPEKKLEVETKNLVEIEEAIINNPDIIMMDNMNDKNTEKGLNIIRQYNKENNKDIKIEVSGNITEKRILTLAKMGVDFISMGELTHSVKAFDFSFIIK